MKIAKNIDGYPIECNGSTDPSQTYTCFICGDRVHPCNELKEEDGRKKEYYFAHYHDHCTYGVESYIHWIAKAIIKTSNEILFPGRMIPYMNAEDECTTFHTLVRPDILIDQKYVVEICCANKKREKQIAVFKQLNITAVEIYLDSLGMDSSLDEIRHAVLYEPANREYLSQEREIASASDTSSEESFGSLFVKILFFILVFFALKNFYNRIKEKNNHRKFAKKSRYNAIDIIMIIGGEK